MECPKGGFQPLGSRVERQGGKIMIGHQDRYALVTGASGGIGYELAKLLAEDGKNLIIISRNKDKLEQVKTEIETRNKTKVKVFPKDLSNPKAPLEIYSELEKEDIAVDVLVNNAGFGLYGMFSQTDLQKELEMIQVNITSLTYLTKLFLKEMLKNKSGMILNVASSLGFLPVPLFPVYAASKSYVLHFSEALACELQGTSVSVTCLCPPPTKTSFWADMGNSKSSRGKMLDATTVAEVGYKAFKTGKVMVVPSLKGKSLLTLTRITPRNLLTKMMKSMV
jgi:short-subunit dehydrogenase